jgi:hypothetical protein
MYYDDNIKSDGKIEKNCRQCNKLFFVYKSISHKRSRCSTCVKANKNRILNCLNCNKEFKSINNRIYCSRSCVKKNKPSWNKGIFGEKSHCWVQDRNKLIESKKGRRNYLARVWRKEIYARDNFKCKINNKDCKGRIEAHHILPWAKFKELRFDINNGITLCKYHHPLKDKEVIEKAPLFINLIQKQ